MKLGRLILTHREDLVEQLRKFYLGPRTDFLVIAYNVNTVHPERFTVSDTSHLVPYYSSPQKGPSGNISGEQYRVWVDVVRRFPGIDGWVIHDYDFVCRPGDRDIFNHLDGKKYAMIGKAFPVWQEGMDEIEIDTYPFPESHRYWHKDWNEPPSPIDVKVDRVLMATYPYSVGGVQTIMGGYSDFIATTRKNILLLDDLKIREIELGGIEQVPHTLWRAKGVAPVDMRRYYKLKILLDVVYIPLDESYDMLHPIKFWPGGRAADLVVKKRNLEFKLKGAIKRLIRYKGTMRHKS